MKRSHIALVALLFLVGGCREDGEVAEEAGQKTPALRVHAGGIEKKGEVNVQGEENGTAAPGPGMQRLVEMAKEDLSGRLAVAQDEIELMAADYVTWPDSSAGCPQPGMQYLQVLTNGSRIKLRSGKKTYHYHSGGNRPPFLCEKPAPIDPSQYGPGET